MSLVRSSGKARVIARRGKKCFEGEVFCYPESVDITNQKSGDARRDEGIVCSRCNRVVSLPILRLYKTGATSPRDATERLGNMRQDRPPENAAYLSELYLLLQNE